MRQVINYLRRDGRVAAHSLRCAVRTPRWLPCACLLVLAPVMLPAQNSGTSQTPLTNPPPRPTTITLPAANRVPDANEQMKMREQQEKKQDFTAANAERKKQISDDSAKLLKLATELKAEVEKTSKDTLSLNVIRKADEIERLAHNVKEKMKLSVGGS